MEKEASCGWFMKTHEGIDINTVSPSILYDSFNVYITGYRSTRVNAIIDIRNLLKLDLKQARGIIDDLPYTPYIFCDVESLKYVQNVVNEISKTSLQYRVDGLEMITDGQAIDEGLIEVNVGRVIVEGGIRRIPS